MLSDSELMIKYKKFGVKDINRALELRKKGASKGGGTKLAKLKKLQNLEGLHQISVHENVRAGKMNVKKKGNWVWDKKKMKMVEVKEEGKEVKTPKVEMGEQEKFFRSLKLEQPLPPPPMGDLNLSLAGNVSLVDLMNAYGEWNK
jgi:hypothetical protein